MCGCLTCSLLGTWPATQACALTGNRTGDPLACRLALNPLSHTSQSFHHHFIPGPGAGPVGQQEDDEVTV